MPRPGFGFIPLYDKDCPLYGTEHDRHYYPLGGNRGSMRCIGWHALHRDIHWFKARFHADYVRGQKSNLIHRCTHEGRVCWFPYNFHRCGPSYIAMYEVGVACQQHVLKNPTLLDAEGVKKAEPYEAPTSIKKYKEVTLCVRCFPTPDGVPEKVKK